MLNKMGPDARIGFHLRVVRGEDLSSHSGKAQDVYIKMEIDGYTVHTSTSKRVDNLCWDEEFRFLAPPTAIFHLRIKYSSKFLAKKVLGRAQLAVGDLLSRGSDDQEFNLNLEDENHTASGGKIVLQVRKSEVTSQSVLVPIIQDIEELVQARLEDGNNTGAQSLSSIVKHLGSLAGIVDEVAKIYPLVAVVWQVTSSIYKAVQGQIRKDEQIVTLLNTMKDVYSFVDTLSTVPDKIRILQDIIEKILLETFQCAIFIQEYMGCGFTKRTRLHALSDTAKIDQFISNFVALKSSLDMGVTVGTGIVLLRALDRAGTAASQQRLDALLPAQMDLHGRIECLPGTRLDIIKLIVDWAVDPKSAGNIFWLHGVAGSGKSTLSTSLANIFRATNCLGAFLFFNRDVAERCKPSTVLRTIAYQLGVYDHRIGDAVSNVVEAIPTITRGSSQLQFTKLLVEPLASLADASFDNPIVIILDAIDECGSVDDRKALLKVILADSAKLPPNFRILIIGRPEQDTDQQFGASSNVRSMRLSTTSDAAHKDITIMLRARLAAICADHISSLSRHNWPGENRIKALVERACGLFVWVATACKFLDAQDAERRLGILLANGDTNDAQTALDKLYFKALESVGRWSDSAFSANFRDVVGTLLVVKNPMSANAIDRILSADKQRSSYHAISRFGCLFWRNAIIKFLHPSLADFLSDLNRCQSDKWFIDVAIYNVRVANHCIDVLEGVLEYNICNLKISQKPPRHRHGLSDDAIYACSFWVEHVCGVSGSLMEHRLESFLSRHLLHWLEAMSAIGMSRTAVEMLMKLIIWHEESSRLESSVTLLLRDSYQFVLTFINIIERHPLLVYTTALPFTPVNSLLYNSFHDREIHPWVTIGYQQAWSTRLSMLPGRPNRVHYANFSPKADRIATASATEGLAIYDNVTGIETVAPVPHASLEEDLVAMAFSADGTRIATVQHSPAQTLKANTTRTVYILDSTSGQRASGPMSAGEGPLNALIFSPDGAFLACSVGHVLSIWDALAGLPLLMAEQESIRSICFFPDSSRMACGSSTSGLVSIKDSRSGAKIVDFPDVHPHCSKIVAMHIDPDGRTLTTLGDDWVVGVLDVLAGTWVCKELQARGPTGIMHGAFCTQASLVVVNSFDMFGVWSTSTGVNVCVYQDGGWISSIDISADGTLVASASRDRPATMWSVVKTETTEETQPAKGNLQVSQLSCSHNGKLIGITTKPREKREESDKDITVIDAETGEEVCGPLQGHTAPVLCHSFSTDGLLIVSGSKDKSIRVWDTATGEELLCLREAHQHPITCVAFTFSGERILSSSPDNTFGVWSADSGSLIVRVDVPRGRGLSTGAGPIAAISPDGTRVVTATETGSDVRVWDVATGAVLVEKVDGIPYWWRRSPSVGFSEDGMHIFLKANESSRYQWDATTGLLSPGEEMPATYSGGATDDLVVNSAEDERWVVNVQNRKPLCQIPFTVGHIQWTRSSKTTITLVTADSFVTIRFPACLLLD